LSMAHMYPMYPIKSMKSILNSQEIPRKIHIVHAKIPSNSIHTLFMPYFPYRSSLHLHRARLVAAAKFASYLWRRASRRNPWDMDMIFRHFVYTCYLIIDHIMINDDKWIWKDIFRHSNIIYVYIPLIKLMKHTHIYIYTWIELYRPWILRSYITYIYIYYYINNHLSWIFFRDRTSTFPGFSCWVSGFIFLKWSFPKSWGVPPNRLSHEE
jgi:hypothetical protein